jgi:hypothetical protein
MSNELFDHRGSYSDMINFRRYSRADVQRFNENSFKSLRRLYNDIHHLDAALLWHKDRILKVSNSVQVLIASTSHYICEKYRQFDKGIPGYEDGIFPTNCPYTVSGQRKRGEHARHAVVRELRQETGLRIKPNDPNLVDLSVCDEQTRIRPSRVFYDTDSLVIRRRYQLVLPEDVRIPNPLNKDNGVRVFCECYDQIPEHVKKWLDPDSLFPANMS